MPDSTESRMIAAVLRDGDVGDEVAIEEPLEITVDGRPLAVTMRTPGHDEELALGFLSARGELIPARAAGPTRDFASNVVQVACTAASGAGRGLLYHFFLRGLRSRGAGGSRGHGTARRLHRGRRCGGTPGEPARPDRSACLRPHRRTPRHRPLPPVANCFSAQARTLNATTRWKAIWSRPRGRDDSPGRPDPLRHRPPLLRARPEGGRRPERRSWSAPGVPELTRDRVGGDRTTLCGSACPEANVYTDQGRVID